MSVLWPSPVVLSEQGPHSTNLYKAALPVVEAVRGADMLVSGALSFNGVVSEPALTPPGSSQNGSNWTFYNRILLLPAEMELGNMLNAQTRQMYIWNGFMGGKFLSSFDGENDYGITVAPPVTPPYTVRPLEMLRYVFSISMDGPAAVGATYNWTIDGQRYTLLITGSRAVLFPFPANFRDDVVESLEWRTDVLRSYDGSEQRRALRTKARRGLEFRFSLLNKRDSQLFQNIMFAWQNRVFAVPVWCDSMTLSSAVPAGATTLPVAQSVIDYSFVAGSTLVVYGDPSNYEVCAVRLPSGNTVEIENGLTSAWPAGTKVFPVILGHMPVAASTQRVTDTVLEGVASFQTSPDNTDPFTPSGTAAVTYDGLEVITAQPNWAGGLDLSYDFAFDTLDMNTGPIAWATTEISPSNTRKYRWLLSSRSEIAAFRSFLGRQRGRAKTCWVPSWTDDFTLTASIAAAETSIKVADNGFRLLVGVNTARDRIAIRLTDGAMIYRRITGVSAETDGDVRLILDAAITSSIGLANVRAIHFLNRCRFATDKIDLAWKSDRVATVDTSFTTVTA